MAVITNLSANPFVVDFSDFDDAEFDEQPWERTASGGASVGIVSGVLQIDAPVGTDWTWDNSTQDAPRLVLKLFPEAASTPTEVASSDFYVKFRVDTLVADGGSGKAAAGLALVDTEFSPPDTVVPIIEFGSEAGAGVDRIYHSYTGPIGGVLDAAFPVGLTLPFFVRVVRADNVVYAQVSQNGETGWTLVTTDADEGRYRRATAPAGGSAYGDYNAIAFYARNEGGSGPGMLVEISSLEVTTWSRFAVAPAVADLQAKSWISGERIDLSWVLPAAGENEVRSVSLWRHRLAHMQFRPIEEGETAPADDGYVPGVIGDKLYEGDPISSYSDTGLLPDRFYYYTLFTSRVPYGPLFTTNAPEVTQYEARPMDTDWGPEAAAANKVTGHSITDYATAEGLVLYYYFPAKYREEDEQDRISLDAAEGYLSKFSRFLQGVQDRYRALVGGLIKARDPEQAMLGLVGDGVNQQGRVEAFLQSVGVMDPKISVHEAMAVRRLMRYGVNKILKKGPLVVLCEWVELLTGWRNTVCSEPGLPPLNHYLRTWDGFDQLTFFSGTSYVAAAGTVTGFTGLTVNQYKGWWIRDFAGRIAEIASNDETSITFVDDTFEAIFEIDFTADVAGSGDLLTIDSWPAAVAGSSSTVVPNDDAYEDTGTHPKIAGDNGGSLATAGVTATIEASGTIGVPSSTFVNGVGQSFSIGYGYTGATYAARVLTKAFHLYTPNSSFLYDNRPFSDVQSQHWRLWPDSTEPGSVPTDVLVEAPLGATRLTCDAIDGVNAQWVEISAGPTYPEIRPGDFINPNVKQSQFFQIWAITEPGNVRYWVRPTIQDVSPDEVAVVGDSAMIVSRTSLERFQLVQAMGRLVLPWDCRLFLAATCPGPPEIDFAFSYKQAATTAPFSSTSEGDIGALTGQDAPTQLMIDWDEVPGTFVRLSVAANITSTFGSGDLTLRHRIGGNTVNDKDPIVGTAYEAAVVAISGAIDENINEFTDPVAKPTGRGFHMLTAQRSVAQPVNIRGVVIGIHPTDSFGKGAMLAATPRQTNNAAAETLIAEFFIDFDTFDTSNLRFATAGWFLKANFSGGHNARVRVGGTIGLPTDGTLVLDYDMDDAHGAGGNFHRSGDGNAGYEAATIARPTGVLPVKFTVLSAGGFALDTNFWSLLIYEV